MLRVRAVATTAWSRSTTRVTLVGAGKGTGSTVWRATVVVPLGRRAASTAATTVSPASTVAVTNGSSVAVGAPGAMDAPLRPTSGGGLYPDWSATVPTLEGSTAVDWYLSWFMAPVDWLHGTVGLPWWGAIAVATLGYRLATAPLIFSSLLRGARMQKFSGELADFRRRMKAVEGDKEAQRLVVEEMRAYMKRNKLNPFMMLPTMITQMGLFMSIFFAFRSFAKDAHLLPGFMEGGLPPWVALHLPDPTYVLPLAGAALGIASLVVNPTIVGMPQAGLTPKGQRLLFGSLSILFLGVSLSMPSALQLYFVVTTGTMLGQQFLLRSKRFRSVLGFPDSWPLTPEQVAAQAKRSGDSFMAGAAPFFRRVSALADLDFPRAFAPSGTKPQDVAWVGMMGLRAPAPPPPPEALHHAAATSLGDVGGVQGRLAAAVAQVGNASAAAVSTGAAATAAKVVSMPAAPSMTPGGGPTLLTNRPSKRGGGGR